MSGSSLKGECSLEHVLRFHCFVNDLNVVSTALLKSCFTLGMQRSAKGLFASFKLSVSAKGAAWI